MWLWALLGLIAAAVLTARHVGQRYATTRPTADKKYTQFRRRGQGPTLSIVIPCYNEEERLPPMLTETIDFCERTVKECTSDDVAKKEGLFSDYEILVVDDCSKDNTIKVAEKIRDDAPKKLELDKHLRIVRVNPNHGKGFAVRTGFFEASGDYVLMADGDNATKIDDTRALFKALRGPDAKGAPVIAIGSRAHLEEESMATRTLSRTILMKAFHLVVAVSYFCGTLGKVCHLRDTQCGFKLFNRRVCSDVFNNNRLERWAFDVELLLLAQRFGLGVAECAVKWAEIPGSKVNVKGMAQMGLECLLMCFTYPLRFWPIKSG